MNSIMPIRFGQKPRDVSRYATPSEGNGNPYLRLYETQPEGLAFPWLFVHHENARGAVHVVPVVTDKKGRQFVHMLVMQRFPMGDCLSIELPAGLWGDHDENETPLEAAPRELKEETGYKAKKSVMLSQQPYATSTGMTTEEKSFVLTFTKQKPGKTHRDEDEVQMIQGSLNVPLAVFMDPAGFERWVAKRMAKKFPQKEYIIGMDTPAARGLMPRLKKGRLDISG